MINILSLIKALEQNNKHVEKSKALALDFKPIILTRKKPKKKEVDVSDQVKQLQGRVSALQDRVELLENKLKDTQNKVSQDINRLVDLMKNLSGNERNTSTYRGP
jgi:prophage DNA circulation protein|tara:strand:- start:7320 stop:7634 length:315 start_codon:yes stop_codon:yes gene_type:complete